jgi:hypothetical protein
MSELSVGQLKGLTANNNVITVPSGHTIYAPGSVVQVQTVRSDSRTTISSPISGNGTTITQLNLAITPKFANSKLIMQWMINGEMHENNVILVHRNGSLITTAGETAYNSEAGNSRWSGVASSIYDADVASTIENYFIQYFCTAGSTSAQTFAPAVRASGGTAYTFFLNRTSAGTLTDNQESTISTGIIWEIAQ